MKMLLVWFLIMISDPAERSVAGDETPVVDYEASLAHRVYGCGSVVRLARRMAYRARHAAVQWVAPMVGMVWRHRTTGGWWPVEMDRPEGWLTA